MIVSPATLRHHLEWLRSSFDIVCLSDWLKDKASGAPLPKRACAITLDDGWRDNYEFAFPVFGELNVPATIFVVSDYVGTAKQFWPNRLSRVLVHIGAGATSSPALEWLRKLGFKAAHEAANREDLAVAIGLCKGIPTDELLPLLRETEAAAGMPPCEEAALVSWNELRRMVDSGIVEVGSHTCTHVRLGSETSPQLAHREIAESRRKLQAKLRCPIRLFCYPNGDMSEESASIVRRHYDAAVTTRSGINSQATDVYELKRIGLHEDAASTRRDFLARLSSWV